MSEENDARRNVEGAEFNLAKTLQLGFEYNKKLIDARKDTSPTFI